MKRWVGNPPHCWKAAHYWKAARPESEARRGASEGRRASVPSALVALTIWEILWLAVVGLAAGTAGGFMGIGGSIIMIPAMAFLFHDRSWDNQHLYQASAMVVNFAVAVPAASQHRRAGAVPSEFVRLFVPATMVSIVAGVFISNLLASEGLRIVFAVFLVYVAATMGLRAWRGGSEDGSASARISAPRVLAVGASTGVAGGVLGIGGGVVSVPLAHALCRLPLRQCIGASATAMVFSAPMGAAMKLWTLGDHGASWRTAVVMGLALAPTAMLGGHMGARMTHRAPLGSLRVALSLLLLVMAGRMIGLY